MMTCAGVCPHLTPPPLLVAGDDLPDPGGGGEDVPLLARPQLARAQPHPSPHTQHLAAVLILPLWLEWQHL